MDEAAAGKVRNDVGAGRYEMEVDGQTAFAAYRTEGDVIVFTHTEVPPLLEGRGIATELVRHALADARANDRKVIAECEFVAAYFKRHPAEQDLLAA